MQIKIVFVIIVFSITFIGCVSTDEFIGKSLKKSIVPNSTVSASVILLSEYDSGIIFPYDRYEERLIADHPGYSFPHGNYFQIMLNEYISLKFPAQMAENDLEIFINIDDFWIEEYSEFPRYVTVTDRMYLIDWLRFTDIDATFSARIKLTVNIDYNGEKIARRMDVSNSITATLTYANRDNFKNEFMDLHFRNFLYINNRVLSGINTMLRGLGL